MTTPTWEWLERTGPFSALDDPARPAHFVVEQISDKNFSVDGGGFRYNPPDGGPPVEVTRKTLPSTDFASIPRFLSWLVGRYGRHTPAALVHDCEVVPGMTFTARAAADRRFLEMMDEIGVPPVQGRLMWSAVTLATRKNGGLGSKAGLVLWGGAAAGGMALLVVGAATGTPALVAVALVGPALASLLWGGQWKAGLIGGYALPLIAVPALAALVGYVPYWLLEKAVQVGRRQLPHNEGKELTEPIGYLGR
jgi:Protein of unknown function (DUF1353)